MFEEVAERLQEKKLHLEITKGAKAHLIEKGFDVKYGARPMRRVIQKEIEDQLSMEILKNRFEAGDTVVVGIRNEQISFKKKREKKQEKTPVAVESSG
jgi:ATP-dependent Clp protease ATP-binding subunit ClpC